MLDILNEEEVLVDDEIDWELDELLDELVGFKTSGVTYHNRISALVTSICDTMYLPLGILYDLWALAPSGRFLN